MSIIIIDQDPGLDSPTLMDPLIATYLQTSKRNKMELHLIENILLEYLTLTSQDNAELVISSLFSRICPQVDWECHFLIRILRNQNPLPPWLFPRLDDLLKRMVKTDAKVCICHGIERIIRVLVENKQEITDNSLVSLLVSYALNHFDYCTQKGFYYKALFWISNYIHEKSVQFRSLLRTNQEKNKPWYILACYQIAWECRIPTFACTTGVCLECNTGDNNDIFHCLEDKDTYLMTVLCLIADLCFWKRENGDYSHMDIYNSTFLFMKRTDSDPDVIISLLNESPSILKFFISLCKVLEWDYQNNRGHRYVPAILQYLMNMLSVLEEGERRNIYVYSIGPLLRRIKYVLNMYHVVFYSCLDSHL